MVRPLFFLFFSPFLFLVGDVDPLVSADLNYSIETAADLVNEELIQKL